MKLSKKDVIKYKLGRLSKVVKCGFHSGFPACCVKFYVCDWLWKTKKEQRIYYKSCPNVGYVPCPDCNKEQRFVQVKRCCGKCITGEGRYG